jgi:hypothetical protein
MHVHLDPGSFDSWALRLDLLLQLVCGRSSVSCLRRVPILNSDVSKIGARIGIISAALGIGALIGSPVSGAIISANGGSYTGAQVFSGSALIAGGLFILAAREIKRRQTQEKLWMKL